MASSVFFSNLSFIVFIIKRKIEYDRNLSFIALYKLSLVIFEIFLAMITRLTTATYLYGGNTCITYITTVTLIQKIISSPTALFFYGLLLPFNE